MSASAAKTLFASFGIADDHLEIVNRKKAGEFRFWANSKLTAFRYLVLAS